MLIGFFIITISSFGLGVIAVFDHSSTFLYSALTLRFFQGQGDVLLQFVGYSIICNVFADDIMRHIAYVEIAVGLGLGIGPLVGGFLYGLVDYEYTMYCFAGLNFVTMVFIYKYIPNSLNETASDEEIAELDIKVVGIEEEIKETL